MQQVKYPQFDIESSNQQANNNNLQQQLFINKEQEIKYIPVLTQQNQNLQQYQQVMLPYPQQINNQQEYYNLDQPPQPSNSLLIKDSDFLIQKFFLGSILGMFILWTFLFTLIFFILMIIFGSGLFKHKDVYPYYITVCICVLMFLTKLGQMEKCRDVVSSPLCYFGSIIAYTLTFFFIFASFTSETSSEFPMTFIVAVFIITPLFGNFIVTIILLIYILVETKEFKFYKVIICEFLCVLPFAIIYVPTLISLVILLPYTFLLMNVLKQIQSGRFNLNKDQVLSGTMAAYYGIFVPFDLFD
ncbi:unnamed protein product [Paramecium sonneborni]|uniref:Transmembrane protein n=1 Tax=Paramecium sonneborni TaxID=65129 RepID=A0A8S1RLZ9_9CILI|nr:unnamed protein product [Paramecium sonneborni]